MLDPKAGSSLDPVLPCGIRAGAHDQHNERNDDAGSHAEIQIVQQLCFYCIAFRYTCRATATACIQNRTPQTPYCHDSPLATARKYQCAAVRAAPNNLAKGCRSSAPAGHSTAAHSAECQTSDTRGGPALYRDRPRI